MLFSFQFYEAYTMFNLKVFEPVYKRTLCDHSLIC